jgi:ABC-type maltose transport system permease subunit
VKKDLIFTIIYTILLALLFLSIIYGVITTIFLEDYKEQTEIQKQEIIELNWQLEQVEQIYED